MHATPPFLFSSASPFHISARKSSFVVYRHFSILEVPLFATTKKQTQTHITANVKSRALWNRSWYLSAVLLMVFALLVLLVFHNTNSIHHYFSFHSHCRSMLLFLAQSTEIRLELYSFLYDFINSNRVLFCL